MGNHDRTVAGIEFLLDVEGRDVAALIDAIEEAGYHVEYLTNPDDDEPHAYIDDLDEETSIEYGSHMGVNSIDG